MGHDAGRPSAERDACLAKAEATGAAHDGPVDWAAVRDAYEGGAESVAAIQQQFGISAWQLRRRRTQEGWSPRAAAQPGPLQGKKPVGDAALEQRLHTLLMMGVTMLTKRLAEEGLNEGTARVMTEVCRAADIMRRSQRVHRSGQKSGRAREKKNNDAGHDLRDDPEWLLAEINRRLDRLGAAAAAGTGQTPAAGAEEGRGTGP